MKKAFYNALPIILVAALLCFAQGATVTTTGVQTLTHKSLTSPTLTGTAVVAAATFSGLATLNGGYAGVGTCSGLDTTDAVSNATSSYAGTGLACTLTTRGGKVLVTATGVASATTADGHFALKEDSSTPSNDTAHYLISIAAGAGKQPYTVTKLFTPAAGSHTYALMCLAEPTGTVNCSHGGAAGYFNGSITAVEVSQ